MANDARMDIWFAVWLTEFIMMFIINAFTLIVFARSRRLRKRNTYLIINLTVADLLVAAVSGPESLWFFKTRKRPKHGFKAVYLIFADIFYVASLSNLALISLERLHATLYPFRHCLIGNCVYYKIIFYSWLGALSLASIFNIIRINDTSGYRYIWIFYVIMTLLVLTVSYVIIILKMIGKPHVQQLGSVISAERKLSVTLFIVSAASTLTLLPWVITSCISISSGHLWVQFSQHAKISNIVLAFYYLNSILNPLIYAMRLLEFRRASHKLLSKNTSSALRDQPIELA